MLNRYFLTLFFIVSSCFVWGQDTIELSDPPQIEEFVPAVADTVTFRERAFTEDFKDKYSSGDFIYERKPVEKNQWDRFWEWLSDFFNGLFGTGNGKGFNITMWIIAGIILLGVVYFIVRSILNKESMWIFDRQRKKIHTEDITEVNLHEMDFGKLISETKAIGDYRLAVRFYYLWVLKKLSLREIINWHWQKTNSDYLYEISDSSLRKDFEYLSYLYDYSWYGEFPLDEAAFGKAEKAFMKTLNTL